MFFQAEDGIRDVERSRGLGDVYKRQCFCRSNFEKLQHIVDLSSQSSEGSEAAIIQSTIPEKREFVNTERHTA